MSAALPPLDAGDGYAKELAKWRARLAAWEETFAIWDLEEPHCLIGAPAALRAHSAAALPAHGSRAAACEPSAPEAQGGWHGGQPAHLGPRSLPHVPPAWACLGTRGEQRVAAPQPQP